MANSNIVKKPLKRKWKAIGENPYLFGLIILVLISLFLFSIYPMYSILKTIFVGESGLDFKAVQEIFDKPRIYQTIWNSLKLGISSAIISTLIGFIFAYSVTRTHMFGKKFFNFIAVFPVVSPPFVLALAMILLFGSSGLISKEILGMQSTDVFGFNSLLVIQAMCFSPIAYLNLKGVLETMDASLEDSAFNLGASRWKVFYTITLPLAMPGVFSSLLLTFIKSLEDFGNPMIIGGDYSVLATEAYMTITGRNDLRTGALLAVSMLIPVLTAYLVQKYWVNKKSYTTVTGKTSQGSVIIKDKKVVVPLFITCLLITGTIVLFYGTIIVGAFVEIWGVNYALSLKHFQYVFDTGLGTIKDTVIIAVIATPIMVLLGMIISFLTVRISFPGKKLVEIGSILLFAVPGTVVGIGYLLSFNSPPLAITGTAAILVLVLVFRYMSLGIEAGTNALMQIDSSLEEASKSLNANGFTTFWKITFPLLRSALFSSAIYAFTRALTSISAVIFLVSASWNLMTVAILSAVDFGKLGVAAAYCVILFVIILIAFTGLNLLLKQNERSM
ncbi:iron ABC transporter permease [Virgibacillus sp. NKC19-3]|uniref:ABC transporter permease n=1 Tax=Virgibacillus saliphilus TaxID=2831674 RepID=UPI001C9AF268|nr:iron ABC transporter permease [Virgibacillus sp. NKC19-3]MBY7142929.1 iron ABC transporter permease [Virgibacillus sp. NKC19-3]